GSGTLGPARLALIVAALVGPAVGVLLALRFLVVLVLQVGRFIAELEIADQLAGGAGKRFLVRERFAQLLEVAPGSGLHIGAPHVHHRLGRFWRRGAQKLLPGGPDET